MLRGAAFIRNGHFRCEIVLIGMRNIVVRKAMNSSMVT